MWRDIFPLVWIVDGGEVTATEPSTVLDVSSSPPRVVREGAISRNVIERLFAEYD
jgi:tRNA A37 threonylcarbamoyladenosine synthetase subunit TsaC/SUA5/YrdC